MTALSERERIEGQIRLLLFKRFIWGSPQGWLDANILLGRAVGVVCALGFIVAALWASECGVAARLGALALAISSASGFYHAACFLRLRRRVAERAVVPSDIQGRFNDALAAEVSRRYARRGRI